MTTSSDNSPLDWVWSWVSSLILPEIRSSLRVRSNEMNQVFRLNADNKSLFLKVGPDLQREYHRLQWLEGRLPCPTPVGFTTDGNTDAFLMSAVEGEDLAHLSVSLPPQVVFTRLAEALRTVHNTSITDWPFGGTGRGLVHGDACLPNFLYYGNQLSGYIDIGDMTTGDPEVDLAAAIWTLQKNLGSGYGLLFLRAYGLSDKNEEDVERLRLRYENDS